MPRSISCTWFSDARQRACSRQGENHWYCNCNYRAMPTPGRSCPSESKSRLTFLELRLSQGCTCPRQFVPERVEIWDNLCQITRRLKHTCNRWFDVHVYIWDTLPVYKNKGKSLALLHITIACVR